MQGDVCRAAVESALALGYRHIDTAEMYGNEDAVGAGIASAGIARKDLHAPTKVSLDKLRRDHVDLYLVHWPSSSMKLPVVLETLMKLKQEGRTRAIGVANFT